MKYNKTIRLKDGRNCIFRNGTEQDGKTMLDIFVLTHEQTDYLLTYPEENSMTAETVCCLYHQKKDFISVPYEPKNDDYLKQHKTNFSDET